MKYYPYMNKSVFNGLVYFISSITAKYKQYIYFRKDILTNML